MITRALVLVLSTIGLVAACGPSPKPTSTTPPTPGSAVILPSPASAEAVPRGDAPAGPSSSSSL